MKIVLTGGGTSGHLLPLLSVAGEIKKRDKDVQFLFIGPKSGFNVSLEKAGIAAKEVQAGKIRRYFSWQNFPDIFRILIGTDEAIFHIWKFKPDVIFSKGGFGSFPAVAAGHFLGIPIMTHESDAVPGLANKIIGLLSDKIFISFPGSEKHFQISKTVFSGNPVRKSVLEGSREEGVRMLEFREGLPIILIFGGSQGAQKINEILFASMEKILKDFQVVHICGKNNFDEIKEKFEDMQIENKDRYRIFAFLDEEMASVYAAADLVVCRAGANSLAEIIALEKPSLVIPLSTAAANHQYFNAKHFAEQNMILMSEEKDLDGEKFLEEIGELKERASELRKNLTEYNKALGDKKPAEIIAEGILGFED